MSFPDRITGSCYGPTPLDPRAGRWLHLGAMPGQVFYLATLSYQGRKHTSLFLTNAWGTRMSLREFVFCQCDAASDIEFNGRHNVDPNDWRSVRMFEEGSIIHAGMRELLGDDFARVLADNMEYEDNSPIFDELCAKEWDFAGRPGLRYPGYVGGEWKGPDLSAFYRSPRA